LRKKSFSARGYAEIHIERPFFDNKKDIYKILGLKIRMVKTCSSASSTRTMFFFCKKTKILIFGGTSKFLHWADFCNFWQFWAEFAALTVANSMPNPKLKSSDLSNS
jgi:hypothetical protein